MTSDSLKIIQADFHGDANIGLFAKSSDKICLIGNFVLDKTVEGMKNILGVDVRRANIANTDLIGLFCVMNSKGILLPKIVSDKELAFFKKMKREFGVEVAVLPSKFTAIGNLIATNDKGAVISSILSRAGRERIEDCLDVETEYSTVAGQMIVGSLSVATNRGCVLHRDAEEAEMERIEEILKVKVDIGTANFGSPFVGSAVVANSIGAAVGGQTTGPEVVRISEILGLV